VLGQGGGSDVTVTSARLLSLELGPNLATLANGTSQRLTPPAPSPTARAPT